jgi:transposase
LRGSDSADNAVRAGEVARAAGGAVDTPDARLLVKQRTQLINMIRGLPAEFGVDIPKGLERALLMARQIVDGKAPDVPIEAAKIVGTLSQQALDTHVRLREIDRDLAIWLRGNDVARRLMTIPVSGRSARRLLQHRLPIRISSARGGNSLPDWD